jgi:Flp pilus assembly protein CpaB
MANKGHRGSLALSLRDTSAEESSESEEEVKPVVPKSPSAATQVRESRVYEYVTVARCSALWA